MSRKEKNSKNKIQYDFTKNDLLEPTVDATGPLRREQKINLFLFAIGKSCIFHLEA